MNALKIIIAAACCIILISVKGQYTDKEYRMLNKTAKKPNVFHLLLNGGLGISTSRDIHMSSRSETTYTSYGTTKVELDSSFQKYFVALIHLDFQAEFVETRRLYISLNGSADMGWFPGKSTWEGYGVTSVSKGNNEQNLWELTAALGTGGNGFKLYALYGLGGTDYRSIRSSNSEFQATNSNPAFKVERGDTISYRMNYQKVALGIRIGTNRKQTFDLQFYKLVPSNSFFRGTERPDMLKILSEFGKNEEGYPAMPYGVTAAYTKMKKFKVVIDYKILRDAYYREKNASSITLSVSKNLNWYDQTKK